MLTKTFTKITKRTYSTKYADFTTPRERIRYLYSLSKKDRQKEIGMGNFYGLKLTGDEYNELFNNKNTSIFDNDSDHDIHIVNSDLISSNKPDINFDQFGDLIVNNKKIKYSLEIPSSAKLITVRKNTWEQKLIEYFKKIKFDYVKIKNDKSINKIYALFFDNQIFEPENSEEMNYLGVYYEIIKNFPKMEKYYFMSMELGNSDAMNNFAYYYHKKLLNVKYRGEPNGRMLVCYLLAIEKGNSLAMYNLGHYYYYTVGNYELARTYLLMAIEHGNSTAMIEMGNYYYYGYVTRNIELAEKYYMMAFYAGKRSVIDTLINIYRNNWSSNCNYNENYKRLIYYLTENNMTHYYNISQKSFDLASKYKMGEFIAADKTVIYSNEIRVLTLLE
jgi:TPR repeat protein